MSIAILVYHRIVAGKAERFHDVTQADFLAQLQQLRGMGLAGQGLLPRLPDGRGVMFSFDDGTEGHAWAAEQLAMMGWRGLFLVSPQHVDGPGRLAAEQVRQMVAAGHTIGAHGHSHRTFDKLSKADLVAEILAARDALAALCGTAPIWFAPPGGIAVPELAPLLRQAGFKHCRGMRWGLAAEPMAGISDEMLPVLPVTARTGKSGLGLLLRLPAVALAAGYAAKQALRRLLGAGRAEAWRERLLRRTASTLVAPTLPESADKPADLLFAILRHAATAGLPAAMRDGLERYPEMPGHDADLIVAPRPWRDWLRLIDAVAEPLGWRRLFTLRRGHLLIVILGQPDHDGATLQLDLHRAGSGGGVAFAEVAPLLARAERQHGLLWLRPEDAAAFVAGEAARLDFATLLARLRRQPVLVLRVLAWKLADALHSYCRPAGRCWSLSGPDGAGKTSLIAALLPLLERRLFLRVVRFHTRPFLLGLSKGGAGDGARPQYRRPGRLASLARLALALADYALGYWLRLRPAMAGGALVLFDRHVPDYRADGAVRGIALPAALLALLDFAAPAPHGRAFLLAAAETLVARKGELDAAQAADLLRRYRALVLAYDALVLESDQATPQDLAEQLALAMRRQLADTPCG